MIFQWVQNALPDSTVTADYRLLVFTAAKEDHSIRVAVKMGCTNLGSRSINGEWSLLPGINYVLYCFDIDHEKPVFEQFHIFTKEEFLQMWRDLDLVRLNISSAAHKRLRAVYGVDLKFNQAEHADSMAVQVFKTSKKKTKLFEEAFARFPVLTMDALQTICKA